MSYVRAGGHLVSIPRGVVQEVCSRCEAITLHHVIDDFRQDTFNFFAVGVAAYEGVRCVCTACKRPRATPSTFDEAVSPGLAEELEAHEVLARSNPALARQVEVLDRLEALAAPSGPYRGREEAALLAEPVASLRARLLCGEDTAALVERLADWERLEPAARLDAIDAVRAAR